MPPQRARTPSSLADSVSGSLVLLVDPPRGADDVQDECGARDIALRALGLLQPAALGLDMALSSELAAGADVHSSGRPPLPVVPTFRLDTPGPCPVR